MPKKLTISQLNKIGERLRKGSESEEDLRLLDEFRLSFGPAYQQTFDVLNALGLKTGGREGKTTESIRAKLVREGTRLSKMQDIAGCRVEVDHLIQQDLVVSDLKARWPQARIYDRRVTPSSGYRAVHLVVEVDGHLVEIQVRTSLQHIWASTTEKLSDVLDSQIKYGGGPEILRKHLQVFSDAIAEFESIEKEYSEVLGQISEPEGGRLQQISAKLDAQKLRLKSLCEKLIMTVQ